MASIETLRQIKLNHILYLTDFSAASDAALPIVSAIASGHGSKVFVAHVLLPDPYVCMAPECAAIINDGLTQIAKADMERMEAQFKNLPHQTVIVQGSKVWTALQPLVQKSSIDLIVLGTPGRTGIRKLLLGSVAEDIWRRSSVPVLTIGPAIRAWHPSGRFNGVLFATDFTPQSLAGLPYAISMARENHSRLVLLHVIKSFKEKEMLGEQIALEAIHRLNEMLPRDAELWCIPRLVLKYGEPAEHIIEAAREGGADLIVLGIRKGDDFGVATHAERTTAHNVVVNAPCAVLTIRG